MLIIINIGCYVGWSSLDELAKYLQQGGSSFQSLWQFTGERVKAQ